jgi:hypothetical protein
MDPTVVEPLLHKLHHTNKVHARVIMQKNINARLTPKQEGNGIYNINNDLVRIRKEILLIETIANVSPPPAYHPEFGGWVCLFS